MVSEKYSRDFISGLGAGIMNIAVTYPISKITYRQILENTNMPTAAWRIAKEGPYYLYRGGLAPMIQKATSLSIMFGVYNYAKATCKKSDRQSIYFQQVCAGMLSGVCEVFVMPFDRVQILLVNAEFYGKFRNMTHAFKVVGKEYGIREFYRGFTFMVLRNSISNSVFFISRLELLKHSNKYRETHNELLVNFFFGGVLGSFVSTLFYPLKVVKVTLQKDLGGPFMKLHTAFGMVYAKNGRGIKNFYQGAVANASRSLLSWGITIMCFEIFQKVL